MQGARLEVSDPMGGTRVMPIEDNRFTVGRGHGNSLSLNIADISRVHAEIVKKEDRYILRDLGSRHGTFVNFHTVVEHTLNDGDQVQIGKHSNFRFLLEETCETDTMSSSRGRRRMRERTSSLVYELARRRRVEHFASEELLDREELDPRVPAPRGGVEPCAGRLGAHRLRGLSHGDQSTQRGILTLDDSTQLADVQGRDVSGLH